MVASNSSNAARIFSKRINKIRLLVYGSVALAFLFVYLWKHADSVGFGTRTGGRDLPNPDGRRPRRTTGRPRVFDSGIVDDAKPEVLKTSVDDVFASMSSAPRDCCGDSSAPSCRTIPKSNHLLVFVSVPNVASGTSRRFPLRKQWHKSLALMEKKMKKNSHIRATPRTALRFVIGTEGMDHAQLESIRQEAFTHQDVLLIDAPDEDHGQPKHRSATTLKVMHSMRYAANNFVFEYFARVGDDAYFRVDYFAELVLLQNVYPRENAYIGFKFSNHIVRESDSTHNFIVGMGFLLTQDLTRYVCRSYPYLLDGFPEDAIVGSWFVGTRARVIHEPHFHDIDHVTTVAYARCSNESLLLHHMWRQENWDSIDEEGLMSC